MSDTDKPPDDKDGLLEMFKKLWLPIAGFLSAITLVYNFYQLWLGDQATITYFLVGGGLSVLVVVLLWIGLSKKTITHDAEKPFDPRSKERVPRYPLKYQWVAWISLGVITIGSVGGGWLLSRHRQELREKLVVLIAAFDGPVD